MAVKAGYLSLQAEGGQWLCDICDTSAHLDFACVFLLNGEKEHLLHYNNNATRPCKTRMNCIMSSLYLGQFRLI